MLFLKFSLFSANAYPLLLLNIQFFCKYSCGDCWQVNCRGELSAYGWLWAWLQEDVDYVRICICRCCVFLILYSSLQRMRTAAFSIDKQEYICKIKARTVLYSKIWPLDTECLRCHHIWFLYSYALSSSNSC